MPGPSGILAPVCGVALGGLTETSPPHLFTGADNGDLFDLANPLSPREWSNGPLILEDRANYFIEVAEGTAPVVPPGGPPPWLYSVFDSLGGNPIPGFEVFKLTPGALTSTDVSDIESVLIRADVENFANPDPSDTIKHYGGILVRSDAGGPNAVYVAYGPRPGYGGIPSILARESASSFGSGNPEYFHTPMQTIYLAEDTTASQAFYLADTRGGIHRVQFN